MQSRDKLPEPGEGVHGERFSNLPVGSDYDDEPQGELDLGNTSGTPHAMTPRQSTEASPVETLRSGVSAADEWERKFGSRTPEAKNYGGNE
jgi:hypothetical protein